MPSRQTSSPKLESPDLNQTRKHRASQSPSGLSPSRGRENTFSSARRRSRRSLAQAQSTDEPALEVSASNGAPMPKTDNTNGLPEDFRNDGDTGIDVASPDSPVSVENPPKRQKTDSKNSRTRRPSPPWRLRAAAGPSFTVVEGRRRSSRIHSNAEPNTKSASEQSPVPSRPPNPLLESIPPPVDTTNNGAKAEPEPEPEPEPAAEPAPEASKPRRKGRISLTTSLIKLPSVSNAPASSSVNSSAANVSRLPSARVSARSTRRTRFPAEDSSIPCKSLSPSPLPPRRRSQRLSAALGASQALPEPASSAKAEKPQPQTQSKYKIKITAAALAAANAQNSSTTSSIAPSVRKPRIQIRVPPPEPAFLRPGARPAPRKFVSFGEWLENDDPLEGDEDSRLRGAKFDKRVADILRFQDALADDGILGGREEVFNRLSSGKAIEPPAVEDPARYYGPVHTHWENVIAHSICLRRLMRREGRTHAAEAKRIAQAVAEEVATNPKWESRRVPVDQDEVWQNEERHQNHRYRQLVKDVAKMWDLVHADARKEKLKAWELEQQEKSKIAFDTMLDRAKILVEKRQKHLEVHAGGSPGTVLEDYSDGENEGRAFESSNDDEENGVDNDSVSDSSTSDLDPGSETTLDVIDSHVSDVTDVLNSPSASKLSHGRQIELEQPESETDLDDDDLSLLSVGFHTDNGEETNSNHALSKPRNSNGDNSARELHDDNSIRTSGNDGEDEDDESEMTAGYDDSGEEEGESSDSADEDDSNEPDTLWGLYSKYAPDALPTSEVDMESTPLASSARDTPDLSSGVTREATTSPAKEGGEEIAGAYAKPSPLGKPDSPHLAAVLNPSVDNADPGPRPQPEPVFEPELSHQTEANDGVQVVRDEPAPNLVSVPTTLLRGTLREYQHRGLDWLAGLYAQNTNGILADEMGLGKTIQTISLLAHLAVHHHVWGPHLIVVPTSVMLNWEMEFKKWCPGFKILTYYGTREERKKKRQGWMKDDVWNVVITSYQLILQDALAFKKRSWHYLVLDEAHNIKNFQTQRWQTLLNFRTHARLLLTGTPLQNNLSELWSLLFFLMPGGLGSEGGFAGLDQFISAMRKPADQILEQERKTLDLEAQQAVKKLHEVLRPYILRRLKADVEKQIPAKYEHVVLCKLSKRQRQLYDEFLGRDSTRQALASGNYMNIINCLMNLRKVCNHPDLFETRPIVTSLVMKKSVFGDFDLKEVLVRRRMLKQDDRLNKLDLPSLGLQFACSTAKMRAENLLEWSREARKRLKRIHNRCVLSQSESGFDSRSGLGSFESNVQYIRSQREKSVIDQLCTAIQVAQSQDQLSDTYSKSLLEKVSLGFQDRSFPRARMTRAVVEIPDDGVVPVTGDDNPSDSLLSFNPHFLPAELTISDLSTSIATRSDRMKPIISRFGVVTPAVVVEGMAELSLPSPAIEYGRSPQGVHNNELFHEAQVRLSIAFPEKFLLQYDCGKLQTLDKLLRRLQAGGHRALIFTQMTMVLDILESFLNMHGHRYLRLDGSTKIEQRQLLTDQFNSDPRILCFILSSRSGGLGINLTGADTVIFYDLDWNPAMDKQCQDRAHRIGQTRDVHIYRLVSEYTIEMNILKKSNQKRLLDDVIIQKGDFTTDYFNRVTYRDAMSGLTDGFGDEADGVGDGGGGGDESGDVLPSSLGHDLARLGGGTASRNGGKRPGIFDQVLDEVVDGRNGRAVLLAEVEDQEDAVAARVAAREMQQADLVDFTDVNSVAGSVDTPGGGTTPGAGCEDGDGDGRLGPSGGGRGGGDDADGQSGDHESGLGADRGPARAKENGPGGGGRTETGSGFETRGQQRHQSASSSPSSSSSHQQPAVGHVDDYMLRLAHHELRDVVVVPAGWREKSKKGRGAGGGAGGGAGLGVGSGGSMIGSGGRGRGRGRGRRRGR